MARLARCSFRGTAAGRGTSIGVWDMMRLGGLSDATAPLSTFRCRQLRRVSRSPSATTTRAGTHMGVSPSLTPWAFLLHCHRGTEWPQPRPPQVPRCAVRMRTWSTFAAMRWMALRRTCGLKLVAIRHGPNVRRSHLARHTSKRLGRSG